MPSFSGVLKAVIEAARKPAVPEAVARGTAEHPAILDPAIIQPLTKERAPKVPFAGAKEIRPIVRETKDVMPSLADKVQHVKTQIGGLIRRDPNLPKDVQEKLYRGAWRSQAADEVADLDVAQWFSPLQRDPTAQATLVADYMVTADEVAQAMRYGKTHIKEIPIETWKSSLDALQKQVDSDPEIQQAIGAIRAGLDEQFDDLAARQWIDRSRYLHDYTPIRRISAVLDGLATFYGEDAEALKSRLLTQQHKRTGSQNARETDLIKVLRATRGEYLRKVAEHEAFLDLAADPTINVTEHFANREQLPKGFRVYRPGAGAFGSTVKSNEGYFIDAALKALDPKGNITLGGWVFPSPIVEALEHFSTPVHTGAENWWYKTGSRISRMLTVYNPANTNVNRVSDLLVALTTPGEGPTHAMGVLRWYGKAAKASYKGAYGKGKDLVNLHGRTVDIWDLAVREGLTSGTIAHDVGAGLQVPPEILRLYPEAELNYQNWWDKILKTMQADRLATEASPRIAAGLEAVERTGDWSQFGKVGRDITFRYGAGSPRVAQFPAIRMISPFLQFQGLATARILDMAGSKSMSTKARVALATISVPLSFYMWNSQNDEYKQVELALPEYERNQLHIIVPDPLDPAKVRRDIEGQPVVLRFRYWVPEQVMAMAGLGNLPERVHRVVTGRDTPIQFSKQTVGQAGENVSSMLVLPAIIREVMTGKTESGMNVSGLDLVGRVAPATRIGINAARKAEDYGPVEGAKTAFSEAAGLRFAKPRHVDYKLLDAQLQEAIRLMREKKGALVGAAKNKGGHEFKKAHKEFMEAVKDVKRLKDVIKREKASGYAPPKGDRTTTARRRAVVKKAKEAAK